MTKHSRGNTFVDFCKTQKFYHRTIVLPLNMIAGRVTEPRKFSYIMNIVDELRKFSPSTVFHCNLYCSYIYYYNHMNFDSVLKEQLINCIYEWQILMNGLITLGDRIRGIAWRGVHACAAIIELLITSNSIETAS